MIRIDVVMPVGPGAQPFIADAIASILASVDVDVRLIMVLDGRTEVPTEASALIDARCTVLVNRRPRGVAGAMNTGVAEARTEFLANMHADDVSHPMRLRRQADALSQLADVAVLGTGATTPEAIARGLVKVSPIHVVRRISVPSLLLSDPVTDPSAMFRLSAIERVGGYRDGMRSMQDYDLILRLATLSNVAVLDEPLLGYRIHDGQYSRKNPASREWRHIASGRRSLSRAHYGSPIPGSALGKIARIQRALDRRSRRRER